MFEAQITGIHPSVAFHQLFISLLSNLFVVSCNGLSAQSGTKRLPKLIYTPSLLPDKELNRKLTELSLPVTGNRQVNRGLFSKIHCVYVEVVSQTRVKRHQEFTLMYNAECDKENPRTSIVQCIVL